MLYVQIGIFLPILYGKIRNFVAGKGKRPFPERVTNYLKITTMRYINTLEATIRNYKSSELDEMYRILFDATCESYNYIHFELFDNPIHRTLAKYFDMVSREMARRGIQKK